jgi:hypothetical protein
MRIAAWCLLGAASLAAQTPTRPQAALIRGVLLERDMQPAAGQFSVRTADNQVLRYQFDRKTYVEREHDLIDVPRLKPGEKVEVVSDAVPGSPLRYARTIHVLDDPPPPRPLTQGRYRAYRSVDDRNLPTGNLTYSGVVFRISADRLMLHTRTGGEQSIQLRKDTRYLQNGDIVDPEKLALNTRVFIRAGKDLYDQVEAYQVIWGTILDPKP